MRIKGDRLVNGGLGVSRNYSFVIGTIIGLAVVVADWIIAFIVGVSRRISATIFLAVVGTYIAVVGVGGIEFSLLLVITTSLSVIL